MKRYLLLTVLFLFEIAVAHAQTAPTTAPTAPITRNASDVISIYGGGDNGNMYTDVAGVNYNPNWGQTTMESEVTIAGNKVLKYDNFGYQGTDWGGSHQNISTMQYLHVDIWTDTQAPRVFVISSGAEIPHAIPTVAGSWQSLDIPVTGITANLNDVYQFKFDNGSTGTIYLDNLYFWKTTVAADTDATLSDLKVDGTTVTGFSAGTTSYTVPLPFGTTTVPTVTAITTDGAATKVITQAASLPGSTTVVVTSQDGTATKTYTVAFQVAPPNTECSGTGTVTQQGETLTAGYNYSFATTGSGSAASVTMTFELLDTKSGLIAYAWKQAPFAETEMTNVGGQKFSYTITNQTVGSTIVYACKFAYAANLTVTKYFTYTVGNICIAPDTQAPTNFTASVGAIASTSVELLLNGVDDSGLVTYTVTYGTNTVTTTGASGTQKSLIINGLTPSTTYSFSITAKDATGNSAANSPIALSATTLVDTNTEFSGTSSETSQGGPFSVGYTYSFATNASGDVIVTFELLDTDKTGVVANLWQQTPFADLGEMTNVSGLKFTKTITDQTIGSTISYACKFAYAAGGLIVTKYFAYTLNYALPVFTAVAPICYGETLNPLPTTSDNGITGTWYPELDNTKTTTYIFRPNPGQFALSSAITIVVDYKTSDFTPVAPICAGTTLNELPTTSNNGFTGVWSQPICSSTTTTYTFTPTPGQCANTATLTILVLQPVIPTFPEVDPINEGDTLSPLPTTSLEGITGFWSPSLNNTTTTTYTFTPDPNQCAIDITTTIKIIDPGTGRVKAPSNYVFGENYITKTVYKTETTALKVDPTVKEATIEKTFYDGLGRAELQKYHKQSNTGKDIITPIEYDTISGRQEIEYLPYVNATASLDNEYSAVADLKLFYSSTDVQKTGNPNFETTSYPYSEKEFENSPLNRVLKQAAPGNDWAMDGGHEIKFEYLTNSESEVKCYKAVATWNITNGIYDIALINTPTNYAAGTLYKTVTKNENWNIGRDNTTEEFKDLEGRVVLKRTYNRLETFDTYYVYDQYGNLTYVIPPLVTDVANSGQLSGLCYQYKYDYRNRMVEKKLPGKQWEYIVYDKLDRVVATGPVNAPFSDLITENKRGWMVTKYDALNRVVYTGWQQENTGFDPALRYSKQNDFNKLTNFNESKSNPVAIDGITYYTNSVSFTSSAFNLLTMNYYDDYGFSGAPTFPASVDGQNVYFNTTDKLPKGLQTGSWVRVLEKSTTSPIKAEVSYMLYDKRSHVLETKTTNYLGGYTTIDNNIDAFTGRVIYTLTKHKRLDTDPAELVIKDAYTYSDQDRLLTHTHQINGGTTELLTKNEYDELGKLINKSVGGTDITGTAALQKVDYSYNIRGWLTGINNDPTNNLVLNTTENDLFAFKISYNDPAPKTGHTIDGITIPIGTMALYNGNISETYWRTRNDITLRKYGYSYDSLNRLTYAEYQKPESSVPLTNSYNESVTYDKNGNIMRMVRNGGIDDSSMPYQIDNLTYYYSATSPNQLMKVSDTSNDHDNGFNDDGDGYTDPSDDYAYDSNGNMTKDENKKITSILYNHLNLPTEINFVLDSNGSFTGQITYIYDANGVKLSKEMKRFCASCRFEPQTTQYLDGFIYKNSNGINKMVLQFFGHSEGYVVHDSDNGNYSYIYQYKDHLGNIRLSYTKNANNLEIVEENNYYPFGLEHAGYNGVTSSLGNTDAYKYKFQGQEHQDELGLNWDSFKWRNYDPATGRFMSIDPLAEKYSYQSPYNFSENRVVDARELEGLEAFVIHGTTQTRTGNTFSNSALNQLQRIGGNTFRNESFRWNAPLNNNDTFDRALAAKELASYVVNQRASLIKSGKISDSEPITLIGYSHGGNVSIQASDLIYEATGLKVNLLTVSTPAYKTDSSLERAGLAGLEDPNKKTSINSHIQIVHENDNVVNLAQGNETYNTNNSVHPVKNYVIKEQEVNLSGGIESHTKLPSNSNFAEYLKKIPQMDNPNSK